MSCIKIEACTRDTHCTEPPLCNHYISDLGAAVKRMRPHLQDYPNRHIVYTAAEADAYWEKLDWWHRKLREMVTALEERYMEKILIC